MNINTKTILASTLLTALIAGTSAYADGDDNQFFYENTVSSETVVMEKVNYEASAVATHTDTVISGKR